MNSTQTKRPNDLGLLALYVRWLKGESLRDVARTVGVRHGTLHQWFGKAFGKKATSLKAMSLVRSVLEDYPRDEELLVWVMEVLAKNELETIQHRSNHSLCMLSKYQTLNESELLDLIATYEDVTETEPAWEFLRLYLYRASLNVIATVLWSFLEQPQEEPTPTYMYGITLEKAA